MQQHPPEALPLPFSPPQHCPSFFNALLASPVLDIIIDIPAKVIEKTRNNQYVILKYPRYNVILTNR
jgi:hypothetical protein